MHRRLIALAAVSSASLLGGCSDLNRGPAIVDTFTLEAISPEQTGRPFPPLAIGGADKPSLRTDSLDRSEWKIRRIIVPAAVTQTRPTYATGPSYTNQNARQRADYPTIESALSLGNRESAWSEIYEGMAWPFWAGLDIALMPARMIAQPPLETLYSPESPYGRAPASTPSPKQLGNPDEPSVPGINTTPTVPSTTEPRWIWRDGKWYLWTPEDPEPWVKPHTPATPEDSPAPPSPGQGQGPEAAPDSTVPTPAQSSPAPAPKKSRWVFRDGRWVKLENAPSTPEPKK